MRNLLNIIKCNMLGFILGAIIFGSIGIYAAIKYSASDVSYKDKTVKEALDELYKGKEKNNGNVYGVVRNLDSSSPAWIRINDSVGLVANAQFETTTVQNDFDNIYPWSEIKSYNYNTDTKEITAWYGESGFTFTPEGNVEVLTYIPEFYYKREQNNGYEYIYITRNKKTGFTKSKAFSIGRYTMSAEKDGNTVTRVHSKSGEPPLTSQTIADFREYARKLDPNYIANDAEHPSEFSQLDYHYFILQLLYLVEYAHNDSQDKLGAGNSYNSLVLSSGGCNDLGMKSGTLVNDGKHSIIYRGIEDIYGNVWQHVDGINVQNYQAYVNYNPNTYISDTFSGDYKPLGYTNSTSNWNYITKLGYDANNSLIAFPVVLGGGNSTYITDFYSSASGNQLALVGGFFNGTSADGFWYWLTNYSSSTTNNDVGARILKTN